MKSCKSQYDYEQLVFNYIEYNTNNNNIEYNNGKPLPDRYISTAKGRLSFDGSYLVSYNTRVAKFIHTKKATYILIDKSKYSNTTTKQLRLLCNRVPSNIIRVHTIDIDDSFNSIKDYYLTEIYNIYKYCKKARASKPLQAAIIAYKSNILSIIPELHPSTRKATLRKLQELPNIPDKLNKFTRPILLSVLKDKGLL